MSPENGHYASVHGLQLYYELHGSGNPLVLIHGGGSTIESTFGFILKQLAAHHHVIAVELQAHGHTKDIDRPLSFEQDADDVAKLLRQLNIGKADFFGFSNGATTCLQIGIRHPKLVQKLILASATYRRDGMPEGFFEGMKTATLDLMPPLLKDAQLRANPDPKGLQAMFDRDRVRMMEFKDIPDASIQSITAPALVLAGDKDVMSTEHSLKLSQVLPNARLAIVPSGHGEYLGEVTATEPDNPLPGMVVGLVSWFLKG